MKKPTKRQTLILSLLALALLVLPAAAIPVFDAANFSQNVLQVSKAIVQISNQIIQIQHQVSQLETMYRNLERFEAPSWRDYLEPLDYFGELTTQGHALSYTEGELFGLYREYFPGFSPAGIEAFEEAYSGWTTIALDTLAATLDSASAQAGDYLTTQEQLAELRALADSADGQLEALSAQNMFSGHVAGELAKLNQLQVASMNAQNVYLGTKLNLEANQEATVRWLIGEAQGEYIHVYTGQGGWSAIPSGWPTHCDDCGTRGFRR